MPIYSLVVLFTLFHSQSLGHHVADPGALGRLGAGEVLQLVGSTARRGELEVQPDLLAPGLHRQQLANSLNGGEYPAVAAMTSGYVFRVENPATVFFLQRHGRTGQLTTIRVSPSPLKNFLRRILSTLIVTENATFVTYLAYTLTVSATLFSLAFMHLTEDIWGLLALSLLILTRLTTTLFIRRWSIPGWFGAPEPGVQGDLLVLLSQDRWIRIRGAVDDLKAVTSGIWLRDPTTLEGYISAASTLLLYATAGIVGNASLDGQVVLAGLVVGSVAVMAVVNSKTEASVMHGRTLVVEGRRRYGRRLEMAEELVKEVGREDWAIKLGMINRKGSEGGGMPIM